MREVNLNQLHTVSEMVAETGFARHQIDYLVKTRDIRPAARIARARVFNADQVDEIVAELTAIAARQITVESKDCRLKEV